jgi:hypothetical protein
MKFSSLLVFTLLFVGFSTALPTNNRVVTLTHEELSSSISSFVQFGYFASQEDPELVNGNEQRPPYALEDGGLCGPTSAHILLTALDYTNGILPSSSSVDEIVRLTDLASILTNEDARFGLFTGDLIDLLHHEARVRGLRIKLNGVTLAKGDGVTVVNKIDLKTLLKITGSSTFLLSTKVYDLSLGKRIFLWDHFILGFDFDPVRRTIKIVDPLYPQVIINARFYNTKVVDYPNNKTLELRYDQAIPGSPLESYIYLTSAIGVEILD